MGSRFSNWNALEGDPRPGARPGAATRFRQSPTQPLNARQTEAPRPKSTRSVHQLLAQHPHPLAEKKKSST